MNRQLTAREIIVLPLFGIVVAFILFLQYRRRAQRRAQRKAIVERANPSLYTWAGNWAGNLAASYVGQETVNVATKMGMAFAQDYRSDMTGEEMVQTGVTAVRAGSLEQLNEMGNQMLQDKAHPIIHPHVSITVYSMIMSVSLMVAKHLFIKSVKMSTTTMVDMATIFTIQVMISLILAMTSKALCGKRNAISDFIATRIIRLVSFENLRRFVTLIMSERSITFFIFRIISCMALCGLFFLMHQGGMNFGTMSYGMALNAANMIVLRVVYA